MLNLLMLFLIQVSGSQTDLSVPKIIEDCLQEERNENGVTTPEKYDNESITDDELDMIGEYMVKESLDEAATDLDNNIKESFQF